MSLATCEKCHLRSIPRYFFCSVQEANIFFAVYVIKKQWLDKCQEPHQLGNMHGPSTLFVSDRKPQKSVSS